MCIRDRYHIISHNITYTTRYWKVLVRGETTLLRTVAGLTRKKKMVRRRQRTMTTTRRRMRVWTMATACQGTRSWSAALAT